MIAREMGISGRDIYTLQRGALLHDVGKVGVSDTVLLKPGKLTPEERKHIETHPVVGANITTQVEFDADIIDMVRHHHERFDGTGYPDKLKGEDISRNARILPWPILWTPCSPTAPTARAWRRKRPSASSARPPARNSTPSWSKP